MINMKKIILIAIIAFTSIKGLAQKDSSAYFVDSTKFKVENGQKVYYSVQKVAEFNGGMMAWKTYLERNLNTDLGAKYIKIPKGEKFAKQTVLMSFTIDVFGNVSNIIVDNLKEVHIKLAREAIRVLQESPKWIPAEQNGKKVIFRHKQSITFCLSEN
jgi:periplasmic protein TonB